jgi:hypothetical protein
MLCAVTASSRKRGRGEEVRASGSGVSRRTSCSMQFAIALLVCAGILGSLVDTSDLGVTPVHAAALANSPPGAFADAFTTAEDTVLVVPAPGVLGNDVDVDGPAVMQAVRVSGPSRGTLILVADGSFRYSPAANYYGSDLFWYKAFDGTAYSSVVSVSLTITPVNDPPTGITLFGGTVPENSPVGTQVGWCTTQDPETTIGFTYALSGEGADVFELFNTNYLRTKASLDYETKSLYALRVRTTDSGGLSFEKDFVITVIDVNEAPLFVITASTGEHGTIMPSGEVSVPYGDSQTFAITPEDGYHVEDVVVDGNSVGAVTTYTFTNVMANHTIAATFDTNYWVITVTVNSRIVETTPWSQSVTKGADAMFRMTPTPADYSYIYSISRNGAAAAPLATGIDFFTTRNYGQPQDLVFTGITGDTTVVVNLFCRGDVNGPGGGLVPDGRVDGFDASILIAQWRRVQGEPGIDTLVADLDNNTKVDVVDLSMMMSLWQP